MTVVLTDEMDYLDPQAYRLPAMVVVVVVVNIFRFLVHLGHQDHLASHWPAKRVSPEWIRDHRTLVIFHKSVDKVCFAFVLLSPLYALLYKLTISQQC